MSNENKYDILFLVDGGIGNVLEALYAVEYCIVNNKKTGVYIHKLNRSFVEFLRNGYGPEVILNSIENISTDFLIHSFTYEEKIQTSYKYYYYIKPDAFSSRQLSETEQYLSVVRGLFPSGYQNSQLKFLPENYSERVKNAEPEKKIILYPGGSSGHASKRWPYFMDLMRTIGGKKTMILGSSDDVNFKFSYYYPKWISVLPQRILNLIGFFNFCKKLKLLKPHAHYHKLEQLENTYFNKFSWEELVAIFRRCRYFIGNDGGLMHLAACCGASGKAIFGPSSVEKNRAYSSSMKATHLHFECQPCSLGDKGVNYGYGLVACPYQLRCQYSLTVDKISEDIPALDAPGI